MHRKPLGRHSHHDLWDTMDLNDRQLRNRARYEQNTKRLGRGFGLMAVLVIVANLAFWGGLIYFAFWTADHFGVI